MPPTDPAAPPGSSGDNGEIEGERVASGDSAGEKEGDSGARALPATVNISCETGDLAVIW